MLIVSVLLNLLGFALAKQATVPAILFSYKLYVKLWFIMIIDVWLTTNWFGSSPGIIGYREEIDAVESLSLERFSVISKELLGQCNSDAYVFINQPGLRKQDFSTYKKEFISLQRYIYSASTALDFESVQLPSNDTFNQLINYVNGECKIDKFISVEGNKTNGFEE